MLCVIGLVFGEVEDQEDAGGVSCARLEKLFTTAHTFYGILSDGRSGDSFRERWPDRGSFALYMVQLWTGLREWTGEW